MYPIIFGCFLFAFWLTMKIIRKMSFYQMLERFLITLAMIFMFFLSSIIGAVADFFNCTQIYNEHYVTNFLIEKCSNNPTYDMWKKYLIIPASCLFLVVFPLILFIYMHKHRDRLFEREIVYKIGFLLNGYSVKSYYWYYFYFR